MSKRFTCTDKWKKTFIKGLKPEYKLLWFYILDDCDHAGIWHIDFEVAALRIGCNVDIAIAINQFLDKIYIFDNNEKWFIPSFIEFQYGELNPANRAHNSVINILKRYNLTEKVKGLIRGLESPSEGVKDKDKEMDKDKDKEKEEEFKIVWGLYGKKGNRKTSLNYWLKLNNADRAAIKDKISKYVASTPDKTFRKDFQKWINPTKRHWEDEIVLTPEQEKKLERDESEANAQELKKKEEYGDDFRLDGSHMPQWQKEADRLGIAIQKYGIWRREWGFRNGGYSKEVPIPPVEYPSMEAK